MSIYAHFQAVHKLTQMLHLTNKVNYQIFAFITSNNTEGIDVIKKKKKKKRRYKSLGSQLYVCTKLACLTIAVLMVQNYYELFNGKKNRKET